MVKKNEKAKKGEGEEEVKNKSNEEGNEENATNVDQGTGQNGEGKQGALLEGGALQQTEKEKLLALYKTLKDLGINSIGDLEVRISRL